MGLNVNHLKLIKKKEHQKVERQKDETVTLLYIVAGIVGFFIGLLFCRI